MVTERLTRGAVCYLDRGDASSRGCGCAEFLCDLSRTDGRADFEEQTMRFPEARISARRSAASDARTEAEQVAKMGLV